MQSDPIGLQMKEEEKGKEELLQLFYIFARADKQLIEGKSGRATARPTKKSAQSLEVSRACNGREIDSADQSSACV